MGIETILAVVACCAMLAAVLMAAFAYRLNENWAKKEAEWIKIAKKQNEVLSSTNCNCKKQNELMQRMLRREQNGRD